MKKNNKIVLQCSFGLGKIDEIVAQLEPLIKESRVIALYGPLGAGKTTLVRAIARALGIKEPITSPSFTYLTQYTDAQNQRIYHFDFYRLSSLNYFYEAGFDEFIHDKQALVFIEWPEMVEQILPQNTVHIFLSYVPKESNQRIIRVEYNA